uniref:acyltransferase family protein n=2 Tax=unclassified Bradyrhizobium TaxID=2631580 RepID=UPI002915C9CE
AMYGMPLFFVLSGFVIHYNYARLFGTVGTAQAVREFATARFARLFPLYLVLLLFSVFADNFLAKTYGRTDLLLAILAHYFSLTQSWWYNIYEGQSIIDWLFPLSWSISTETFFYLAYIGVAFLSFRLRSSRAAFWALITFCCASILMLVASRYFLAELLGLARKTKPDYIDLNDRFSSSFYRWLFYFSPYVRILEFVTGCLTSHLIIRLRPLQCSAAEAWLREVGLAAAFLLLVGAGLVKVGYGHETVVAAYVQHLSNNFVCVPSIAYILFYVARYDTRFTRLLSSPTLVALGEASYSIYLVHTWTLRVFLRPEPALNWTFALDTVGRITFGIAFTLVVSYATYQLIERPSRSWLRARLGRIRATQAFPPRQPGVSGPHIPIKPALVVTMLLLAVVVGGQAAKSEVPWRMLSRLWSGDRPEIEVLSASYGLNCKGTIGASIPVKLGNVTPSLARSCNQRTRCEFSISTSRLARSSEWLRKGVFSYL